MGEIDFEIHSPLLCHHPFFKKYAADNIAAMRMICRKALDVIGPLHPGDVVFYSGEIPYHPQMMFVLAGHLNYMKNVDRSLRTYEAGGWISEHTIWVPWRHC